MMVPWLSLCASNAGDVGSIPDQGTEIPRAVGCSQEDEPAGGEYKSQAVSQSRSAFLSFSPHCSSQCSIY